jgi:hypothetical protein
MQSRSTRVQPDVQLLVQSRIIAELNETLTAEPCQTLGPVAPNGHADVRVGR